MMQDMIEKQIDLRSNIMGISKKRFEELKEFAREVKLLVRSIGRSNFVLKRELEELIVKYNISFSE